MDTRELCIAVESFANTKNGTESAVNMLRRQDAVKHIKYLKFTAEMMMDWHRIAPFDPLINHPNTKRYSVVADLSLSGGYKSMLETINFAKKRIGGSDDITFTFSQLNTRRGITDVIDAVREANPNFKFLITGVLPENLLEEFGDDFYGLTPEEFTTSKIVRAQNIDGITGVYGSAEFGHLRDGVDYLGAGVTFLGGDYGEGIEHKTSTPLKLAVKTCSSVVLGHALFVDGDPNIGLDKAIEVIENS